jgi:hypothetical protein
MTTSGPVNDGRSGSRWRHDIKNQLGIILGFSGLLLQELDAADTRRSDVEEIHAAALRAMQLVADLPLPGDGLP